jgi:predicted permease
MNAPDNPTSAGRDAGPTGADSFANSFDSVLADCRFGLRQLRSSPVFTIVAVMTLALGMGANAAVFSILDPLLLRKLPVRDPDQLVWVNSAGTLGPAEISETNTFYLYREKATVLTDVLAFSGVAPYNVKHGGRTSIADGQLVSGNYFSALGVRPFAGRLFEQTDERGPAAIVLSFDFWRREFDSNPRTIGSALRFGEQSDASHTGSSPERSYTVIGVSPPGFFGAEVGKSPDFYVPLGSAGLPSQDYWQTEFVTILARLKHGVTLAQAQDALNPLLQEAEKISSLPEIERQESFARALLTPAARGLSIAREKFSLPARILMIAVALLLLIACGNIANLLLARGMSRKREISVRLALGAGRWRVVRQLLTESALLAAMGTIAGVLIGQWLARLLVASLSTPQLSIVLATDWNVRLFVFLAALLAFTVLIGGLFPALSATRTELSEELKVLGGGTHRSLSRSRFGRALIVGQVALSTMLLAGAGLLLRSLYNLETFDAGFDRDKVVTVRLNGYASSRTRDQVASLFHQLVERTRQLPGVHSVSYSGFTPISGKEVGVNVIVEGYTLKPGETANERFVGISPNYFETMGISILAGRDFTEADTHSDSPSYQSTNVAIINRTMSHRFFGYTNPVGKHFRFVEGNRPPLEIVGVVADSKYNNLRERATEFFYVPGTHGDLEIRANVPAATLAGPLRTIVNSLDSSITLTDIKTLREQVDESLHSDRLIAVLCGIFSLLALALTCIGLYGMLAFDVARRTSEIGIRLTLGANPADIFRLIVGQGIALTIAGVVLGIAGGVSASSLLASFLFGVHHTDPLTFVAVSLALFCAAVAACFLPASRAMRVAPVVALRNE